MTKDNPIAKPTNTAPIAKPETVSVSHMLRCAIITAGSRYPREDMRSRASQQLYEEAAGVSPTKFDKGGAEWTAKLAEAERLIAKRADELDAVRAAKNAAEAAKNAAIVAAQG